MNTDVIEKRWELKQELALVVDEIKFMNDHPHLYLYNNESEYKYLKTKEAELNTELAFLALFTSDRYYQYLRNKELELRKEFLAIQIDDAEMTRIFRRIWRKKSNNIYFTKIINNRYDLY